MTPRKARLVAGSLSHQALQFLRHRGPAGALMTDVHATLPAPIKSVSCAVWRLVRLGLAAARSDPGPKPYHRRLRYFVADHAPADIASPAPPQHHAATARPRPVATAMIAAWPKKTKTTQAGVSRHRALRLDPAQPAIVPAGVRVTVCPCGVDTRFSVPLGQPVAGAGFVDEWRRLRQQPGNRPARP
jgi:hypothetical protein